MSQRIMLAQTIEAFNAQSEKFLELAGFPVDARHKFYLGQLIQQLPEHQDYYDTEIMAASIRRAIANEFAYYLIRPERQPGPQNGQEAAASADQEMVQKVSG